MKRSYIKWIVLLVIIFAAGFLLTVSVLDMLEKNQKILANGIVGNESMIILLVLMISIPVLLIALLLVLLFAKNKPQTIEAAFDGVINATATGGGKAAEEGELGERFCMLSDLERKKSKFERMDYEKNVTLEDLCDNFRNYAANKLRLYYDIADIRRFISGMAVSHILILQGMSGTGKTSLAHAFGNFMDNTSTIIPVQPMWKERTDLVGYYNEFTKKFNETLLLEKMYEANYSEDIYITVLDELNIARVEYYFAEFLSLLELPNADERYLDVVADKWETDPAQLKDGRIKLPENMWFIGTANNDDSTFAISDKVYDRAMVLNLDSKCERFTAPKTPKLRISYVKFNSLVSEAIEEYSISARNRKRLAELDNYLIEHFHITFGNRIMKQINQYIPVYIACGGRELEALDDILAKKVMRKLETQNPIYLRNAAEGLVAYLDELFGTDAMPQCKAFIHRLERNA